MSVEFLKELSINDDFLVLLENYMPVLVLVHIVISLFLSFFLAKSISSRFVKDMDKDSFRLYEVRDESLLFRLFFEVSLHKNNMLMSILFLFVFNIAIPIFGYIFSIWIASYLKNVSYDKIVKNTTILKLDEFRFSFLKVERIFEESSISDLMNNEYAPVSKKLKALSLLSRNLSPSNLRIIRQTLSSTDDEVRMFGYSIINKAEKSLNDKINRYLNIIYSLDNEQLSKDDEEKKAQAAKELAPLYWEMIYTELSHESMKEGFLKEVEKYINIAKDFYIPQSKELHKSIEDSKKKLSRISKEIEIASKDKKKKKFKHLKKIELNISKRLETDSLELIKYDEIVTKLYILMGRVYMQQGKLDAAQTELTIAHELHGLESSFILPYLAEMYFIKGNYRIVSSIMRRTGDLELNSTLNPVIEQWN